MKHESVFYFEINEGDKMAKTDKKKNSKIVSFFEGVKQESKKVIWTSKKNLLKYSIIALGFMVFICLFFVVTDLLIALLSYLKELIF